VVAPREFYRKNGDEYENDIEYLYYADPSVFMEVNIPSDVKLHVWKKRV
jgi:hypothetical protein